MRHVFFGLVVLGLTLSPMGQVKADYTFTAFDVPDTTLTYALGINDSGQIVGYTYTVAGYQYHGFLLDVDGTYTTLDVAPGSVDGINDSGQIVGSYTDQGGAETHGYVLNVDGTYTTIAPPDSTLSNAYGINGSGQIVGYYNDAGFQHHGFLATPQ